MTALVMTSPGIRLLLILLLPLFGIAGMAHQSWAADLSAQGPVARGLASHRALYTLSVARLDPRNYRNGISGGLSLDFVNGCDGYVLNQRFVIETDTEDGTVLNNMILTSWESLDGRRLRFKLRDEVNNDLDQELDGEGSIEAGKPGAVRFTLPKDTELRLPAGTVFPTHHTVLVLEQARAGGNLLQAAVYDGSSADSYTEVGGFIGRALPPEGGVAPVMAPLKGQRSWPVRLAYFTSDKPSDTPDYEIAYRLFENGVADDIVFDYGDYAIRATLRRLDIKPPDPC